VEGEVADANPTAEGPVDVGDREQDESDEQGEAEDLEHVESSVGGAEERGREDGDESSNEENGPEDGGEAIDALEEAGAAVLGEGA